MRCPTGSWNFAHFRTWLSHFVLLVVTPAALGELTAMEILIAVVALELWWAAERKAKPRVGRPTATGPRLESAQRPQQGGSLNEGRPSCRSATRAFRRKIKIASCN
jgi:hypothetical protein